MTPTINLVKAKWTGKTWQEWSNLFYQQYDTEDIKWFEDYSNSKRIVRDNEWDRLEDDYYGKCKPKDYEKFINYIRDNLGEEQQIMYLKAINLMKKEKDIYFEIDN